MTVTSIQTDLMERVTGGLHVTLLWERGTGALSVRVVDRWQNRVFELAPDRAGYAFHHPFAFAMEQASPEQPLAA
jgi:hypothetical protein